MRMCILGSLRIDPYKEQKYENVQKWLKNGMKIAID